MKTTTATALSLIGVIAAGSAAAMVNTTIFDAAPSEAAASAVILPDAQVIDLTIPVPIAAVVTPGADVVAQESTDSIRPAADGSATEVIRPTAVGAAATEQSDDTTVATTTVPVPSTTAPVTAPTTTAPMPAPSTTVAPDPSPTTFNLDQVGTVTVDEVDGYLVIVDTTALGGWTVTHAANNSATKSVEVRFESSTVEVRFEAQLVGGQIVPEVSSTEIPTSGYHDDDHDDGDHDDDHDDDDHDDDDDDDHDDDHDDDDDDDHDERDDD